MHLTMRKLAQVEVVKQQHQVTHPITLPPAHTQNPPHFRHSSSLLTWLLQTLYVLVDLFLTAITAHKQTEHGPVIGTKRVIAAFEQNEGHVPGDSALLPGLGGEVGACVWECGQAKLWQRATERDLHGVERKVFATSCSA